MAPDPVLFASIVMAILGIAILIQDSHILKWLGKVLCTHLLLLVHAGSIRLLRATGTVGHQVLHQSKQSGIGVLRELSRYQAVPIFRSLQFVLLLEPYQEVHVRETALLKLYSIDIGHSMTQDALLGDEIKELLLLELEYTCHQVWTVCRSLIWQEGSQHLRPIGIGSHSRKGICWTIATPNCQRVLLALTHIPGAPLEGSWQDESAAQVLRIRDVIRVTEGIHHMVLEICTQSSLIKPDPVQSGLFCCFPAINNVLLQELATLQDSSGLIPVLEKTVGIVICLNDCLSALNCIF